jgi:hypothetical protein
MKKKGLGRRLPAVLQVTNSTSLDYSILKSLTSGRKSVAVIRTKGGSGESHAVKEVSSFFDKYLIIIENSDSKYDNPIFKFCAQITTKILDDESELPSKAFIRLPLSEISEKYIDRINQSCYEAIIFTKGLGSSFTVIDHEIYSNFCDRLIFPFDPSVSFSLTEAMNSSRIAKNNNAFYLGWHKNLKNKPTYTTSTPKGMKYFPTAYHLVLLVLNFGKNDRKNLERILKREES